MEKSEWISARMGRDRMQYKNNFTIKKHEVISHETAERKNYRRGNPGK